MKKRCLTFGAFLCVVALAGCPRSFVPPETDAARGEAGDIALLDTAGPDWEAGWVEPPPRLAGRPECAPFETAQGSACLSVMGGNAAFRFATTSACNGEVKCQEEAPPGRLFAEFDPEPGSAHHVVLRDLPERGAFKCALFCVDAAGDEAELGGLVRLSTGSERGVRITEVMANPAGAEPDQEFVEIVNVTGFPLDAGGWRLSDEAPCAPPGACGGKEGDGEAKGDALPAGTILPPLQPVLLVPSGYDPRSAKDVAPRAGCLLVRLDASLGERGLKNGGEPVFLLDAEGGTVSFYPDAVTPVPDGVSVVRVHADYPDGDPLAWEKSPQAGGTPCSW